MASKYFSEEQLFKLLKNHIDPPSFLKRWRIPDREKAERNRKLLSLFKNVKKGKREAIRETLQIFFQKAKVEFSDIKERINLNNTQIEAFSSKIIQFRVKFPSKNFIPEQEIKILKSGKESSKDKPPKIINKEYKDVVLVTARKIVHEVLVYIPTVKKIYFNGYVPMIHLTKGHEYEGCIISFILDVDEYDQIVIGNLESEAILSNFQLRFNYDKQFEVSETTPHLYLKQPKKTKLIDLDKINPLVFEELITFLLNKMGLVAENMQSTYDGGIDVVAGSDNPITGGRFVIQCKRYQKSVPVEIVRDLYGAMTHERAGKGILITTSDFSHECRKWAQGKPIELINRRKLTQLLIDHGYKVAQKISCL